MRRTGLFWKLVVATVTLGLAAALAGTVGHTHSVSLATSSDEGPGGASSDRPDDPASGDASARVRPRTTPPRYREDLAEVDPPPDQPPASDAPANAPGDENPPTAGEEPEPELEQLRLHCEGVISEDHRPGIICRWTTSKAPRFAAYHLIRGDGEHREVVFRSDERDHAFFLDDKVEPGVEYHYLVQVLGPNGGVIGLSNPSAAKVPERPREHLELACERAALEGHRGVACRWSEATRDDASGYVLVRSIDGGPRERIFRTGIEGPNRHFDSPLRPGHRYTYAVLVLDADGHVIGEGGPVTVGWPLNPPPTAEPPAR